MASLHPFIWRAVQVCFVGLVIGMGRAVLPVVAARDSGVPKSSLRYLLSFVISFGRVKAPGTALVFVRETLPWAHAERQRYTSGTHAGLRPRFTGGLPEHPTSREVFAYASFANPAYSAMCQARVANMVADTLLWVLFPLYLHQHGLGLVQVGWVTGVYGLSWGASQLWTGPLSDRIGRRGPVVAGMWLLGAGVAAVVPVDGTGDWMSTAVVMGVGMALLYPNLIAAVAGISYPTWRSSALGTYRYWRGTGCAIGALVLGLIAQARGDVIPAFRTTAAWLVASGAWVLPRAQETQIEARACRQIPAESPGFYANVHRVK